MPRIMCLLLRLDIKRRHQWTCMRSCEKVGEAYQYREEHSNEGARANSTVRENGARFTAVPGVRSRILQIHDAQLLQIEPTLPNLLIAVRKNMRAMTQLTSPRAACQGRGHDWMSRSSLRAVLFEMQLSVKHCRFSRPGSSLQRYTMHVHARRVTFHGSRLPGSERSYRPVSYPGLTESAIPRPRYR